MSPLATPVIILFSISFFVQATSLKLCIYMYIVLQATVKLLKQSASQMCPQHNSQFFNHLRFGEVIIPMFLASVHPSYLFKVYLVPGKLTNSVDFFTEHT